MMRLVKSWTEAMNSQAVADATVCSNSLAGGRLPLSMPGCVRRASAAAGARSRWQCRALDDLDGSLANLGERPAELVPDIAAIAEEVGSQGKRRTMSANSSGAPSRS